MISKLAFSREKIDKELFRCNFTNKINPLKFYKNDFEKSLRKCNKSKNKIAISREIFQSQYFVKARIFKKILWKRHKTNILKFWSTF